VVFLHGCWVDHPLASFLFDTFSAWIVYSQLELNKKSIKRDHPISHPIGIRLSLDREVARAAGFEIEIGGIPLHEIFAACPLILKSRMGFG
jgi:hypothetical protein